MEQLRLRGRLLVSAAIVFLVLVGGLLILTGLDLHDYLRGSAQPSRTGYEKLLLIPVLPLPFLIAWDETLPARRKGLAFVLVASGDLAVISAATVWFLTAVLLDGPGPILRLALLVSLALGAGAAALGELVVGIEYVRAARRAGGA